MKYKKIGDLPAESVMKSIDKSQEDKYYRECFTLIGANKLLREQVADADSMIEEILCSLSHGPDNELVRQAIDIYNQKWHGCK